MIIWIIAYLKLVIIFYIINIIMILIKQNLYKLISNFIFMLNYLKSG